MVTLENSMEKSPDQRRKFAIAEKSLLIIIILIIIIIIT